MAYLMNTWYVAAWASEVEQGVPFPRTLLDLPVVLFRDDEGVAHALFDRCPHRFAPLSLGKVCDNGRSLACAYHGLRFDGSGACVHNPHGDGRVPAAARTRSFPLVERHSCLWIWFGDPARADPALIPDFSCMDPECWHVGKRYLHARANYVLESDNILDLSHIEFLHPGTLGSDAVKQAVIDVKQTGTTVWSLRQTRNEVMPAFLYDAFGMPQGLPVDRWIDVRWDAPACMLLHSGATPTGRPRSEGHDAMLPHLFTPETTQSTHYWFAISFPKAMGDAGAAMAEAHIDALKVPFSTEDLPVLEAQQRAIGNAEFWSLKPVLLAGDAPAVRARRVLDKLIAAEQAEGEARA